VLSNQAQSSWSKWQDKNPGLSNCRWRWRICRTRWGTRKPNRSRKKRRLWEKGKNLKHNCRKYLEEKPNSSTSYGIKS